uniref:Uncharacterized protein n=1 Tax=viral metagenome TaxID=1070528 RepID=A0A6M3LYU7_9ZZZZ
MNREAYEKDPLKAVLNMAYAQAMLGKGKERHADKKPFVEQISMSITKAIGLAYPLGQAWKKVDESQRMAKEAAVRELLGAIVYVAMGVIHLLDGEK